MTDKPLPKRADEIEKANRSQRQAYFEKYDTPEKRRIAWMKRVHERMKLKKKFPEINFGSTRFFRSTPRRGPDEARQRAGEQEGGEK